jgi:2-polyprenyl-3-methyl-5-hydroxy-6-metoxy-1,4-benzoquinol methylase
MGDQPPSNQPFANPPYPPERTGDKIAIPGDYQYKAFYTGSRLQRAWHRFKLSSAINNLNVLPGQHILDAGCGSGMLSALIGQEHPDVTVTGIDGSKDAIAFCRSQWKTLPNLHFEESPIDSLDAVPDTSIDRIAFLEVIEHITEHQALRVLQGFFRILKKDGLLVISTPNRHSAWPLLEYTMDLFRLAPRLKHDQHEQLYSGKQLQALAAKAGLTPLKKQRINFIAPWLAPFSQKLALLTHSWEEQQSWTPGALLLYTFVKP